MTLLLLAIACGGATHKLPTATITVDGAPVLVEVADDPDERAQGLMNRDTMPADEGMLFVYPKEEPRSFWMKDTRIPLTIAYADSQGVIVKIADMQPHDTNRVQSLYPARFALEMNQGWFATHDVAVGDVIVVAPEIVGAAR